MRCGYKLEQEVRTVGNEDCKTVTERSSSPVVRVVTYTRSLKRPCAFPEGEYRFIHSTMQHELLRFSKVKRAARVAASNTSSTPSPVNEEHSRYFLAPISVAASLPSLGVTKRRDFFRISSMAKGSSRRSFFNPTNITGTLGHRSFASSIHYGSLSVIRREGNQRDAGDSQLTLCFTFSNESGVSTANPTKRT